MNAKKLRPEDRWPIQAADRLSSPMSITGVRSERDRREAEKRHRVPSALKKSDAAAFKNQAPAENQVYLIDLPGVKSTLILEVPDAIFLTERPYPFQELYSEYA